MADRDLVDEKSLVQKARNRDLEAFSRIVDAYQGRVMGFVRRMVPNGEDAADVTQEVFIRAFRSFENFDGRSSVRTWLFRIATNLCIDRSRKVDRIPGMVSLSVDEEEGLATFDVSDTRWQPDEIAMTEELAAVVERTIAGMSEKLRSVLLLHDGEDMAYDEIAPALGIPVGTVKSRLFLARGQLQKAVAEYLERGNDLR
jgi:RNA polymerase sigma-70 factor (ECF subfamily)